MLSVDGDIGAVIAKQADAVTAALAAALERRRHRGHSRLWEAMRYSVLAPGKRIRPFLTLEFCALLGGDRQAAMPFALAVECIHASSLIHDDLPCMDDDDLRRGRPTNHKIYGEDVALLAGDALLTLAFTLAAENDAVPDRLRVAALGAMAGYAGAGGMMGGQMMDMSADAFTSLSGLRALQRLKTGALLVLAAQLGCMAAGLDPNGHEDCYENAAAYANGVGAAFQIVDDILDVSGDAGQLGKGTGRDAKNGKVTFVTLLGIDGARVEAARHTALAQTAARKLGDSRTLEALAGYLLERRH